MTGGFETLTINKTKNVIFKRGATLREKKGPASRAENEYSIHI
jgi:hypothetical protein